MPTVHAPAAPPRPDPRDLAVRWAAARRAALDAVDGGALDATEPMRARAVPAARHEELLRAVGANSWRLGRSVARRFGALDDAERLAALLAGCGIPCAEAVPESDDEATLLRRGSCSSGGDDPRHCALCDYYREALDGFVCGASERLRFARRRCAARGAAECEDVLYPAGQRSARFAPLPEAVRARCAGPLARLAARGVAIELLGLQENRLHVSVGSARGAGCGPGRLYLELLAAHLAEQFPELELVDATPRAVMA
jgi:hypothetical protein